MSVNYVKDGTREFTNIINSYKYENLIKSNMLKQGRTFEQGLKEMLIQRNQDIKKHEMDEDESEKFTAHIAGASQQNSRLKLALKSMEDDQIKQALKQKITMKLKKNDEELDNDIDEITDFATENQSVLNIKENYSNLNKKNNTTKISKKKFSILNAGTFYKHSRTKSFKNNISNNNSNKRLFNFNNESEKEYEFIKPVNLNNTRISKDNTIYINENLHNNKNNNNVNKSMGSFPVIPTNISNVDNNSEINFNYNPNEIKRFRSPNPNNNQNNFYTKRLTQQESINSGSKNKFFI